MSVAAPLDEGSDGEALARAQRAHEPSMEEILASIRAIIADERETPAKPGPQIVYSSDAPRPAAEGAVAGPTVVWSRENEAAAPPPGTIEPAASVVPEAVASPAREAESHPQPPSEPAPAPLRPPHHAGETRATDAAALVSSASERAVSQSFQALAERMSAHGVDVATGLAREMMQPLLKAWLDENLPGIVDRLVRSEIERLTKGWG